MRTTKNQSELSLAQLQQLADQIKLWGEPLGLQAIGISDTNLEQAEEILQRWLDQDMHGDMQWMASHGSKRSRPTELEPGTVRVISARMDYLPEDMQQAEAVLHTPQQAYVSRYALGRDYHKLLRKRLQQLANQIEQQIGPFGYRVFVDSAPVLEKPLANKAGLGWMGKHTNILNRESGSWFFLGEIYTNLPLPIDAVSDNHCGTCTSCIDICPTDAIIAPYQLDARKCISYLTIELRGSIPLEYRKAIGNRIYGCDDCQLTCPWNRFAQITRESDFLPRHQLHDIALTELFGWDEATFQRNMEGSAIRRIGYACWIRNIAVALGNAPSSPEIIHALEVRKDDNSALIREHVLWALEQHQCPA